MRPPKLKETGSSMAETPASEPTAAPVPQNASSPGDSVSVGGSASVGDGIQERDSVVIRFSGDSGDGMQLTGDQFTNTSAVLGNDVSTFPIFPPKYARRLVPSRV